MAEFKGRSISISVVTLVFFVLSFIAVALRCFVRLRLVRAFGRDDSLMLLAMVSIPPVPTSLIGLANTLCYIIQALNVLFAVCGITGSFNGLGQKTEELRHDNLSVEKALFVITPKSLFALMISALLARSSGGGSGKPAMSGWSLSPKYRLLWRSSA
jgi:cation-transporting ATPase 13A1